jgi:23S rRNA (guanine745-N1)-methyltransferase
MAIFICPVCGSGLCREDTAYTCQNGHSFDVSAQGYVNLMPSGNSGKSAGDNADMMAARSRFLNKGYYGCLRDTLTKTVADTLQNGAAGKNPLVIDAGCGEGYYTAAVAKYLNEKGIYARAAGIDISKRGIKSAAKRDKSVAFAVAGIFNMPFETVGAAVVISIFAPLCDKEFRRVLAPGGTLIVVGPGRNHLYGLKKAVYDTPYVNDEEPYCPDGFETVQKINVHDEITVLGGNIGDLFMMTPYFWNTPLEEAKRLDGLEHLDTPVDFIITLLKKL